MAMTNNLINLLQLLEPYLNGKQYYLNAFLKVVIKHDLQGVTLEALWAIAKRTTG
jgi:hypothetical protein